MNFTTPTGLRRPLAETQRQQRDGSRDQLPPQVEKLLERFHGVGVKCEVVGAFSRDSTPFVEELDVEVLILDGAGLRDFRIWEIVWDEAPDGEVNLVFARDLAQESPLRPDA